METHTPTSRAPERGPWNRGHTTTAPEDHDLLKRTPTTEQFLASRPWARRVWRSAPGDGPTLFWLVLIHVTAVLGLILTPWPGWKILGATLALTWLGGIGTTVCYHRCLAHRSLKLNP